MIWSTQTDPEYPQRPPLYFYPVVWMSVEWMPDISYLCAKEPKTTKEVKPGKKKKKKKKKDPAIKFERILRC